VLAKDVDELTILDVINAVSPLERIKACPLGIDSRTSLCPLHAELDRAYAATEAAFSAVTIKQLLESTSPIVPLCRVPKCCRRKTDQPSPPKRGEGSHTYVACSKSRRYRSARLGKIGNHRNRNVIRNVGTSAFWLIWVTCAKLHDLRGRGDHHHTPVTSPTQNPKNHVTKDDFPCINT